MASTIKNFNKVNQLISENIEDLIFICNENIECEYYNIKEIQYKKHLIDFLHPNDSKRITEFVKNVFKFGYKKEEFRIKGDNNLFKWYEIKGKRFVDEGNSKKTFLICRDISNFKKLENEIRESQIRYTQLADALPEIKYWKLLQSKESVSAVQKTREMLEVVINNIPQLIYWKDTKLIYLGCNTNFASLNGLVNPHSIIGRSDDDLKWVLGKLDFIQECEYNVIKNDKSEYHITELLTTPDGNHAWYEINRIPLHDVGGNVVGILVTYEDITTRKFSEQKLKESEENYRHLVENIPDAIYSALPDETGTTSFMSNRWIDWTGYFPEDFYKDRETWPKSIHPEDRDDTIKKYIDAFKKKTEYTLEYRVVHKNTGEIRYVRDRGVPIFDVKGNISRFDGVVSDITESEEAEQQLRESEEKYRNLVINLTDIILEVDLKGTVIYVSPQSYDILGYYPSDLIGKSAFHFIHPEDIQMAAEVLKKGIQTKETVSIPKYRLLQRNGGIRIASVRGKYVNTNGNEGIIAAIRDITIQTQIEEKLKESEEKYRTIFDSSPDYIFITDVEGVILDMNEVLLKRMGMTLDEVIGINFAQFYAGDNLDELLLIRDEINAGKEIMGSEVKARAKTGEIFEYEVNSVPIKENGRVVSVINLARDVTDKKIAEQKLKESELKYRHLFENSPYSIILINRNGVIIDCNPATEKIFNDKIEKLINRSFLDVVTKSDKNLPLYEQRYRNLIEGVIPEPIEIQITRSSDGRLIWSGITESLVDIGGETVFQVIIQDITEKKVAEQELKKSQDELRVLNKELEEKVKERTKDLIESERQYRTTIDSLGDPLHVVDRDLRIILVNQALKKWLVSLDINAEIIGRKIPEVFSFLPQIIYDEYEKVFDSGSPLITMETTTLPELEVIAETRKIPIFGKEKVEQVITIIRDVTERREMEIQLKESEENFRNMVNNLDVGFYKGIYKGKLLMNNQACNKILGLKPNESIVGIDSTPFFANEKRRQKYYYELETRGFVRNFLAQIKKVNGDILTIDLNSHVIYDSEGGITEVEGTFSDITEKFKLQQDLLESEKKLREQNIELMKLDEVKNDFITMAAHELKTPLISISGYTDYILMKHRNRLSPEIIEDLKTVQRNVTRLEVLMDQLLDVMKIDENKLKLQKEQVNVTKIINDCLDELSYLINEKNLEVILDINSEIILNVDPNRIFTVFTNLISNAIKFTPDYGWIEISCKRVEDKFIFEVKDNGIGLTEDELSRLFIKFEKIRQQNLNEDLHIKDSGTGLGLYITKSIINLHNGEIRAISEGLDKGTTFEFTLLG